MLISQEASIEQSPTVSANFCNLILQKNVILQKTLIITRDLQFSFITLGDKQQLRSGPFNLCKELDDEVEYVVQQMIYTVMFDGKSCIDSPYKTVMINISCLLIIKRYF